MGVSLGLAAFLLFFVHDLNDWRWGRPALRCCFPLAVLLLTGGTVLLAIQGRPPFAGLPRLLWGMCGVLFLLLLLYTLFFALPAGEAYAKPGEGRPVETRGVYALCRHPGVLWFWGLYLCLWAALGVPLGAAVLFGGLNWLLILFEDRWVFPHKLHGYTTYQQTTPFLLPTRRSLQQCCGHRGER